MNRIEGFITAHIGDRINECDDNFAFNLGDCNFAIADGSSSDFFSKVYAQLLVDKYVENPDNFYNEDNIKQLNSEWRSIVKNKLDEAGCKPGSFPFVRFQKMDPGCSTLIGLSFFEEKGEIKYCCTGLGDSVLFFIPDDSDIPTLQFSSYSNKEFSFDPSIEFGYTPIISRSYSTGWLENVVKYSNFLSKGVFFLMTDGLAEWILRTDNGSTEEKFKTLLDIHSQDEFMSYVDFVRKNGAHNDDMTLVKVYVDEVNTEFNPDYSICFDYRKEQKIIEEKEIEERKRHEPKQIIIESASQQQKSSEGSLAWVESMVNKRSQQQRNKQKNTLSTVNIGSIIEAAQTKVKNSKQLAEDCKQEKVAQINEGEKAENIVVQKNIDKETENRQNDDNTAPIETVKKEATKLVNVDDAISQKAIAEEGADTTDANRIDSPKNIAEEDADTTDTKSVVPQESIEGEGADTIDAYNVDSTKIIAEEGADTTDANRVDSTKNIAEEGTDTTDANSMDSTKNIAKECVGPTETNSVTSKEAVVEETKDETYINNATSPQIDVGNNIEQANDVSIVNDDLDAGEVKKKRLIRVLRNHYLWIIIIGIAVAGGVILLGNDDKTHASSADNEVIMNYANRIKKDSVTISLLTKKIEQKDSMIKKMETERIVNQHRFEYIKEKCPKAYKKMIQITN